MYHLASVRLRDLCAKLDISTDLRRKIWTCFEYSLVHCTDLMMDRHIDQLLMCAIYVMTKVLQPFAYTKVIVALHFSILHYIACIGVVYEALCLRAVRCFEMFEIITSSHNNEDFSIKHFL